MRLLTSCRNGGKTEKACISRTNEAAAYFTETKSSGDGAGEVQPCGLRIIDHQSIHLHPFASPAKLPPDFPPHSSFPLTRPGRSTNFLFPFHGVSVAPRAKLPRCPAPSESVQGRIPAYMYHKENKQTNSLKRGIFLTNSSKTDSRSTHEFIVQHMWS